jgi:hypothetical protein
MRRLQVLETIEQHAPASRDPRHHGPGWNIEHLGDFRIRKLFHVT